MFYWLMKYVAIGPLVKAIFRPWIVGRDNVPTSGAAILASNHLSFADSIFLPLLIDRPMSFLAKSDYFTGRGPKGWATRVFMKGTGQIPIDRSGGKASEASLNTGLQILGRGDLLGIYPEGTRSPDGRLYCGRTGIARMALEAKVPVIPVVVETIIVPVIVIAAVVPVSPGVPVVPVVVDGDDGGRGVGGRGLIGRRTSEEGGDGGDDAGEESRDVHGSAP